MWSQAADFRTSVPLVPWGGTTADTGISLTNTCNIDTTLQILVALTITFPEVKSWFDEIADGLVKDKIGNGLRRYRKAKGIVEAVRKARHRKFNEAKTQWTNDVMQIELWGQPNPGNMVDSEYNAALSHVGELFPVRKHHMCRSGICESLNDPCFVPREGSRKWRLENSSMKDVLYANPEKTEQAFRYAVTYNSNCPCGNGRALQLELIDKNTPFLMYALTADATNGFDERELPHEQTFHNSKYTVFAYTCVIESENSMPHFIAKFIVDKKKVAYDGQKRSPYIEPKAKGHKVTSVWLVRKDE